MFIISMLKAQQLGLFDSITHIGTTIRKDGTIVAAHNRRVKKRAEQHPQGELTLQDENKQTKLTKLDATIQKFGGVKGVTNLLATAPKAVADQIVTLLAKLSKKTEDEIRAQYQAEVPAVKPEPEQAPAPEPEPEVKEDAKPETEPEAVPAVSADTPWQVVEHVTKGGKGKTIRGVIRTDLTYQQAKAIDEYTFKKDGGYFIREKHLPTMKAEARIESAVAAGAITEDQAVAAKEAMQSGGIEAAAEAIADKRTIQAAKLRKAGQSVIDKAQAEQGRDRLTNTPKRAREAGGAIKAAMRNEALGRTMLNLADAIESGKSVHLTGVDSKAAVEQLDRLLRSAMYETDRGLSYQEQLNREGRSPDENDVSNARMPTANPWSDHISRAAELLQRKAPTGNSKLIRDLRKLETRAGAGSNRVPLSSADYPTLESADKKLRAIGETSVLGDAMELIANIKRLNRMGITDSFTLRDTLSEYLQYRDGVKKEDPVAAAERALVGQKVGVDFFPTPKPLAKRMAEIAGVKSGMRVLEPSAGNGNLADAAKAAGADVDVLEISPQLQNVLQLKGHNVVGHDFEAHSADEMYDAVIMNPPFSDRKDAQHIQQAYSMLKPGGTLVAIAGEGVFFGTDKKAVAFRDWLESQGAETEKLDAGTFNDRSLLATTGANARLITIRKPEGVTAVSETDLAEDKADLADELMRNPNSDRAKELTAKIHQAHQQQEGPKEGEVNAEGLVFRDGRWHREDEPDGVRQQHADDDLRNGNSSIAEYLESRGIDPDDFHVDRRAASRDARQQVPYFVLMDEIKADAARLGKKTMGNVDLETIEENKENPFTTRLLAARGMPASLKNKYEKRMNEIFSDSASSAGIRKQYNDALTKAEVEQAITFAKELDANESTSTGVDVNETENVSGKAENYRDTFTVERGNSNNELDKHTFSRGQSVKIAGSYPMPTGKIEGISHANKQAKVNGIWYDFGYIYPESYDEFESVHRNIKGLIDQANERLDAGNSIGIQHFTDQIYKNVKRFNLGNDYDDSLSLLHTKAAKVDSENSAKRDAERKAKAEQDDAKRAAEGAANKKEPDAIDMTMEQWKKIHRDFKGKFENGSRYTMRGGKLVTVNIIKSGDTTKETGPQDGDINAEGLVFRDGRWHRDGEETNDEPATDDADAALQRAKDAHAEKLAALRAKIESMGGADSFRFILNASKQNNGSADKAFAIIDKIADTVGLSRDEVMAELGIREKQAKPKAPRQSKPKATAPVAASATDDDLDPNSPNYRYRDTGNIADSRKERAASMLKEAKANGDLVRSTSLDWETIEHNPREAKELITKSNLFGMVDWDGLKAGGMEPGAGFLIDRLYASIGKEPTEDSAMSRKDYAIGIESLRDRMEKCKTAADVVSAIAELRDELNGTIFTADETERHNALFAEFTAIRNKIAELKKPADLAYAQSQSARSAVYQAERELENRKRRGWAIKPEHDKAVTDAKAASEAASKAWSKAIDDARPLIEEQEMLQQINRAGRVAIETAAKERTNANPIRRAWNSLGDKFVNAINYRRHNGSQAFATHVANVNAGRVDSWGWADKEPKPSTRKALTKEQVKFQLKVADTYQRIGGRPVSIDSTMALKEKFGLRDVQSGNWVLRDPVSAKFHVEQSAAALADLADLIGVPDHIVSMNGRLAIAFGARGTGNAGGRTARAHYEPVQRVMNMTKMGGGGCLGHEWFHAFDNMIREMATETATPAISYSSVGVNLLPEGELKDAYRELSNAIHQGTEYHTRSAPYSEKDYRTAKLNVDSVYPNRISQMIKQAGNADDAALAVEKYFADRMGDKKTRKLLSNWLTIAVAYYGNPTGGEARVKTGEPMSSFKKESIFMDEGALGKYWSAGEECSARAFQSWCEDRITEKGHRSDYLSAMADNKYYRDPLTGIDFKPFPEGEERTRINAAFDRLFEVVRKQNIMQKALGLMSA